MVPKSKNATRQETRGDVYADPATNSVQMSGVAPPMNRPDIQIQPFALPRSSAGNQLATTRAKFGYAPASAIPNRNRIRHNSQRPPKVKAPTLSPTKPVNAVKIDHPITIRISVRFGPNASPNHPLGISNHAYAKANAVNAHFRSLSPFSPKSWTNNDAAVPKQTRSK